MRDVLQKRNRVCCQMPFENILQFQNMSDRVKLCAMETLSYLWNILYTPCLGLDFFSSDSFRFLYLTHK